VPTKRRKISARRIEVTAEDRQILMLGVGCYNPRCWEEREGHYRAMISLRGASYDFEKRGLEALRRAWQVYGPEIMELWAAQPCDANVGRRPYAYWLFDHGLEWLRDVPCPGIHIRWPEGIESEQDMVYQHVAKARERTALRERWRARIRYYAGYAPGVPHWFYEKEAPAILAEPEVVAAREKWVKLLA
jgi:hypothetical protein